MKINFKKLSLISVLIILTYITLSLAIFPRKTRSANLTSVKNTLSSSQLSYFARLASGNSAGESIITIKTTGNPSNTTNNLFTGDTLAIGTGTTITGLTNYIVKDIGNTATIQLESGISAGNAVEDVAVIATHSATHTVTFTPVSLIAQSKFLTLIKSTDTAGETANDGIPDQAGFDLGQDVGATTTGLGTRVKPTDIGCSGVGFGVGATGSISSTTVGGENYHLFTCSLGAGVSNALTEYKITVGRDLSSGSQLLNPSAATGHTEGQADSTADTYSFYVRHTESDNTLIDSTQGKIAVVESVHVTATVDPSITFIIDTTNVGEGDTRCGNVLNSTAANTTATAVNFGSLNLAAFNDLAQRLSCVTNANSGYAVTVFTNRELTMIDVGNTIPHTDCDSEDCTTASATEWSTENNISSFGYSLENINAGTTAFSYDAGTYFAKPFPEGSGNAVTIFSNTSTPTTTERVYVCYRMAISTSQQAGEYENGITYTATATF